MNAAVTPAADPSYARFETRRLVLRRPAPGDEAALIALDDLADVKAYLAMRGADPARLAERIGPRIALSQAEPGAAYGWWIIEDRASGAFLGRGLLAPIWQDADEIELGVYLTSSARHKGYATEAGTALLDHAFKSLKLPWVVAATARSASAVRKLLARLGFSHRGKVVLYGVEADRYALSSHGWLPRRS